MMNHENSFLLDAAFIVERTEKTFFGAPLLTVDGVDHTFTFGFVRDVLRFRRDLGMRMGMLLLGGEAHSLTTAQNIENVITFLQALKIPCIHDHVNSGLNVAASLCSQFSRIVTGDKRLLQLSNDALTIALIPQSNLAQWDWVSPESMRTMMGISPLHIPTYLALTAASKAEVLTSRQAVRLIELYGNLDSIFDNVGKVPSGQLRNKLRENERLIRDCYAKSTIGPVQTQVSCNDQNCSLINLDTAPNLEFLRKYGFHSLIPLLGNPSDVGLKIMESKGNPDDYHAVVDRKGLQELEKMVLLSQFCSIDTESDDKDPREATLLGVAFSVREGEAFFVPLIEDDLKGLRKDHVLGCLKRMCDSHVGFIGHNIKYDWLLLRRNGITIKSIYFDTMLAAFDCHGDWIFFNLPDLTQRLLGKEIRSYAEVVDEDKTFLDLPFKELVKHACQDADMAMRLHRILLTELCKRNITEQYFNQTMELMLRLADQESQGIAVDVAKLDVLRQSVVQQVSRLKDDICRKLGSVVDLESEKDLAAVLREALLVRGYRAISKITMAVLEQIAVSEPIVRCIVQYKRLRSRMLGLESIFLSAADGRIYPLFNQIKSRAGLVTTVKPSLFEADAMPDLESCFDNSVRDYFRNRERSLAGLGQITQDPVLLEISAAMSTIDPCMAEHPSMKDIDHQELLLSFAMGLSDSRLSRTFLVDRLTLATIRHDAERRYRTMFKWLEDYRRKAQANGYAEIEGKRKYIDGLKSSDIARREQALEYAIRWLIRY
jgi:DNA polymerase I-like protein with 3'-5' exonuclease and polymerase domains